MLPGVTPTRLDGCFSRKTETTASTILIRGGHVYKFCPLQRVGFVKSFCFEVIEDLSLIGTSWNDVVAICFPVVLGIELFDESEGIKRPSKLCEKFLEFKLGSVDHFFWLS